MRKFVYLSYFHAAILLLNCRNNYDNIILFLSVFTPTLKLLTHLLRYGRKAPWLFMIFVRHGRNAPMLYISHTIKNIYGIQLHMISKGSFGLINDVFTKLQVRVGFQYVLKIFSFSQYGKYDKKLLLNIKIILFLKKYVNNKTF